MSQVISVLNAYLALIGGVKYGFNMDDFGQVAGRVQNCVDMLPLPPHLLMLLPTDRQMFRLQLMEGDLIHTAPLLGMNHRPMSVMLAAAFFTS